MKKMKFCMIVLGVMLLLAGCNAEADGGETAGLPEYPIIDGSSTTVVMHEAIKTYLTGELNPYIQHSRTYPALERLDPRSENPADVILAVKHYDDTIAEFRSRGADLVITPIAKEGFVFMTHPDNPVDNLTLEQLRGIYSGEITNWKDVGGFDEDIVAYTRNKDSGSQTALEDFMDGIPIVLGEDPDRIATSMGEMLGAVYMTGRSAIGYNMYSWAMEQWVEYDQLKLFAIDGIEPSNETLSDSSYPLMVYTYSYYNVNNEKGRALTEWLLSAEGQELIESVGFVGIQSDSLSDD